MKKLIIFIALLMTACTSAKAAGNQMLSTPTMVMPSGVTPIPVTIGPTVDIAVVNATLQASDQKLQQAVSEKLAAQAAQQEAVATAQAAEVQALWATATLGAQEIEHAQVMATNDSVRATENAESRSQVYAQATWTAQAPAQAAEAARQYSEATREAARAKFAPVAESINAAFPCLVTLILLFGLGLGMVALNKWEPGTAPTQYDVNEMDGVPAQPSTRIWKTNPDETVIDRDTEPPCDPEKFRALIEHERIGNYLGINNVISARVYSSNDDYIPVLEWLEQRGYVVTQGGKVFSDIGKAFCQEWEAAHPSPTAENVQ